MSHPASLIIKKLDAALIDGEQDGVVIDTLTDLDAILSAGKDDSIFTILYQAEAIWAVVKGIKKYAHSNETVYLCLKVAKQLVHVQDHKAAFRMAGGFQAAVNILRAEHCLDIISEAYAVCALASLKSEDNKVESMSAGLGTLAINSVSAKSVPQNDAIVVAVCGLLTALTTADDDSKPASSAFPNARNLAKEGAIEALVDSLRRATEDENTPSRCLSSLCGALRFISANDEICQQVLALGGIDIVLSLINVDDEKYFSKGALRPALSLLRQLTSSDAVKSAVVHRNGLHLLKVLLTGDSEEESSSLPPLISENIFGILTNIFLRNPSAAETAADCGLLVVVVEQLGQLMATPDAPRAPFAAKQACMALRNAVARSPDLRGPLLEKGAEEEIRRAKLIFAKDCGEAASAVLRDLGLENYA